MDFHNIGQNTGFTLFFEALIVAMCKEMSLASVTDILRIHEDSVWRIRSVIVDKAKEAIQLVLQQAERLSDDWSKVLESA